MDLVSFDICKGNPGALQFMMEAYQVDMFKAEKAFQKMRDNDILGAKLYMLWNDCCNRDAEMALDIMYNNEIDDIVKHINYENGYGISYVEEDE